jgi:polyhydroxybutyrate depolymerase
VDPGHRRNAGIADRGPYEELTDAMRRPLAMFATTLVSLALGGAGLRADEVLTLTHQGIERTATIHRPAALPAGPTPVVIGLYGHHQTIEKFRDWLHLDVTADREHFLVVYPEAIERDWSYGRPIVKATGMPAVNGEPADDLGFIGAIIDNLIETKRADPDRIYVTGLSRGGLMTFTIACALADRIAAAAPLITGMTEFQRQDCKPAKAVAMMAVDGTNDPVQSYDGWLAPLGRLLSVPETLEYWRLQNDCSSQKGNDIPHRDRSDPTRIWLIEWTGCQRPLRLYRVNGGGHQVPSFSANSAEDVKKFGNRNRDIETADEIWSFFKDLSR